MSLPELLSTRALERARLGAGAGLPRLTPTLDSSKLGWLAGCAVNERASAVAGPEAKRDFSGARPSSSALPNASSERRCMAYFFSKAV